MTDKATLTFSAAAARFVGKDAPKEARLEGACGPEQLSPKERLQLVVYLCNDPDEEVKGRAQQTLRSFPVPVVQQVLAEPKLHPRLLDILVKFYAGREELLPLFLGHPNLSPQAAAFLTRRESGGGAVGPVAPTPPAPAAATPEEPAATEPGENEEIDEESYRSKYQLAQSMGVSEKIKMGLTGDKEWRTLLIKDSNKLVSGAVIKNPRMTESEVLSIAKSAVQNEEIMRVICANKEWIKNYEIKKALVLNHKTPLTAALRFMSSLSEKDVAALAKSKNVSSVISAQARRILMSKSKS